MQAAEMSLTAGLLGSAADLGGGAQTSDRLQVELLLLCAERSRPSSIQEEITSWRDYFLSNSNIRNTIYNF